MAHTARRRAWRAWRGGAAAAILAGTTTGRQRGDGMAHAGRQGTRTGGGWRWAVVALLCGALLLGYAIASSRPNVVFDGESSFGRVRVLERSDGLRSLHTGDGSARQSALYPGRPDHLELAYTRVAMAGLAFSPPEGRLLFVGLGGGSMPMYARHVMPDVWIDAVEIDPLIVDVARRHFGFREDARMTAHTADGRAFIEDATPGGYDVVFLDAFSTDGIPFALTTSEFLAAVRTTLAPGGVVVSNVWSSSSLYESMLATYVAVFEEVQVIGVGGRDQKIVIAGDGSRTLDRASLADAVRALSQRVDLGFDMFRLVMDGYEELPALRAPVLRDTQAASSPGRTGCGNSSTAA
jgi:spermidine synthase